MVGSRKVANRLDQLLTFWLIPHTPYQIWPRGHQFTTWRLHGGTGNSSPPPLFSVSDTFWHQDAEKIAPWRSEHLPKMSLKASVTSPGGLGTTCGAVTVVSGVVGSKNSRRRTAKTSILRVPWRCHGTLTAVRPSLTRSDDGGWHPPSFDNQRKERRDDFWPSHPVAPAPSSSYAGGDATRRRASAAGS